MKCKYCQAEMDEGAVICPACGKEQELPEEVKDIQTQEETVTVAESAEEPVAAETEEAKEEAPVKATPGKIALAVAASAVLLALLVALILSGGSKNNDPVETLPPTAPTEAVETVPATIPPDGNPDDATCKGTYTVTDEAAISGADTVVATIGDMELTNGLLQVYYWEEVDGFLQNYGSYGYFGLDYTQPFDVQICTVAETTMTWQQYFVDRAVNAWRSYQTLALEAQANGIELDEETRNYIDGLADDIAEMAASSGYADSNAMIADMVGAGPSVEDYVRYVELYHMGYAYLSHLYDNANPTAEEVEAYFAERESAYSEYGITKDTGIFVDVRHILIMPEGGTVDESGNTVYSDEEWAACQAKAEDILDQWKKGEATENSFALLANEHSTDPGSNTNGGLYTQVYEGQMVPEFNDWCFDPARQVGDHGVVKTTYGCHVMYFVGSQEIWYVNAQYDLISDTVNAALPAALEKFPIEVDFSAIGIGLVELV